MFINVPYTLISKKLLSSRSLDSFLLFNNFFSSCVICWSNGSLLTDHCTTLDGIWTDSGTGDQASALVFDAPPDNRTAFKLATGLTPVAGDSALRERTISSIDALGGRFVVTIRVYCDNLGVWDATYENDCWFSISDGNIILGISLQDAGGGDMDLKIAQGSGASAYDMFGVVSAANLSTDTWHDLTFDVTVSGTVPDGSTSTCDVYVDGYEVATGFSCNWTGSASNIDGYLRMAQFGESVVDAVSYFDEFDVGGDCASSPLGASFLLDMIDDEKLNELMALYGPEFEGKTNDEKEEVLVSHVVNGDLTPDEAIAMAIKMGLDLGA